MSPVFFIKQKKLQNYKHFICSCDQEDNNVNQPITKEDLKFPLQHLYQHLLVPLLRIQSRPPDFKIYAVEPKID